MVPPPHPFVSHMRDFVNSLPRPNTKGQLAKKERQDLRGSAARNSMLLLQQMTNERRLAGLIRELFPNAPLYHVPAASTLAQKIIDDNDGKVDERTADRVVDCFGIPPGHRCLFITPELFYRDLLREDKKFRVYDKDDSEIGLMLCCPHCQSNKWVKVWKWEVNAQTPIPCSIIHVDATRISLMGWRYIAMHQPRML